MNNKVHLSVFALILIAGMFLAACGPLPGGADIQATGGDKGSQVEFSGRVESIAADRWVVSGQALAITAKTEINGSISVGDMVILGAQANPDGSFTATEIKLNETDEGNPTPDPADNELEFTGVVESIGADSWVIDGKTVAITAETEIKGAIVVGDTVKVEALVGTDGALTAKEIKLVEETPPGPDDSEDVEFTGVVESIGSASWVVDGKTVAITAETEIKGTIVVGDTVKVEALVGTDGAITAKEIKLVEETPPGPDDSEDVEFTGVVESIGSGSWVIDGKTVAITAETEIKGAIVVGDTVKVEALVGTDGALTAKEIKLVEETPPGPDDSEDVEFTGVVESIGSASWVVDGKTVAITAETEIKGTIVVGDTVKVEALVGSDGALTAKEIQLVEDDTPPGPDGPDDGENMEFTGKVESIGSGSWVIDGKTVAITAETEIKGAIVVGDTVKVEALVGSDGALTAREIQLVEKDPPAPDDGEKMEFTGVVESIGTDSWVIDGKTVAITAETEIKGTIVVGDTVTVHAFRNSDGTLIAHEIEIEKEE